MGTTFRPSFLAVRSRSLMARWRCGSLHRGLGATWVVNRPDWTWEIRPSRIEREACGNVSHGNQAEAHREACGYVTEP
jgi:hypothetical protein